MLTFVSPGGPAAITRGSGPGPSAFLSVIEEMVYYQLVGDTESAKRYAIGIAIDDHIGWEPPDWYDKMRTWLVAAAAGYRPMWRVEAAPPKTAPEQIAEVHRLAARFVARIPADHEAQQDFAALIRILIGSPEHRLSVATALCRSSAVLDLAPDLCEPSLYSDVPMAAMMDATRPEDPSGAWMALRTSLPEPTPDDTTRALALLITA
jgi:hypothetical protein